MHVHEHVRSHRDFQHQNILKKLSQTKGFDVYARKLIAYKDILWNKYQSKNIYKNGHTLFDQIPIEYIQMDMDINGPYAGHTNFYQLQQENPLKQ